MAKVNLDQTLTDFLDGGHPSCLRALVSAGLDALPVLRPRLLRDQPLDALERVEDVLKEVLSAILSKPADIAIAQELAIFQQSLGFLLKYKSYAVKATTPLGYSIFLQTPGEGFSFQRHLAHKMEVFHILESSPGSFVFLCNDSEWSSTYKSSPFDRWLKGEPNTAFDSFKRIVSPGDVFPIVDLGTVHSAIGCIIEEFATVSTDMVERLHDQNLGRPIPPHFNRDSALGRRRLVRLPPLSRVFLQRGDQGQALVPRKIPGGTEVVLHESSLRAARYHFHACEASEPQTDRTRATLLHVFEGKGEIVLTDDRRSTRRISLSGGNLFMIPPAVSYHFCTDTPVMCSEHRISPSDAFLTRTV